ncbi:uncharacterized protein [Maniola hyperantus]|uniref:uncharacterized protein n=1 Tax=Aphantopus hyperantus TaxID=2795564 RepID=UPI0015685C00|nr:uncharacterized protein LOC117988361 [Maniola hyperantus]
MFAIRSLRFVACRANKTLLYGIGVCSSGSRQKGDCDGDHSDGDSDKSPRHLCSDCNPSAPAIYDSRKYGHNLPCDSVMPYFETLPYFPTGIFRCTAGEVLGLGANKCGCYKNPEYFSFHHMSFYDMHMLLRCYRNPSPKTGRKK